MDPTIPTSTAVEEFFGVYLYNKLTLYYWLVFILDGHCTTTTTATTRHPGFWKPTSFHTYV